MKTFYCLTAAIVMSASASQAQTTMGAFSISSPQGSFGGNPIDQIIDQSGLSARYSSGVTAFDEFVATTTHNSWSSEPNVGFTIEQNFLPQQFTFDMGSIVRLDAIAFWALSEAGGVTGFELYADDDDDFSNGTFRLLGRYTANTYTQDDVTPAQVFAFKPLSTRYVHIQATAAVGGPDVYSGIGEVVFRVAAGADGS